jgi:hypothetical protein
MKKLFLLLFFVFFILSGEASAQDQQTPENYLIKYSGTGLPDADSLLIYSKPGMFKIEEYFSIDGVSYQKIKYLLGKHLTTIDIKPGKKTGKRVDFDKESFTYIKNSIDPVGIQKYKDYTIPAGEEILLDFPCSIYENADGSMIWVADYKYILKVFNKNENTEITAFEFMPDASMDDSIFEIPPDADIHSIYDSK